MYKEPENINTLIRGCKINDHKAQEQLYRCFYRAMMNLCLRYTKNETDATEVLNIGFLKIFINIQQYDPVKAAIYTWVRTIIVNSCIDYIKARQKEITSIELVQVEETDIDPEVFSKMETAIILQLVRSLPPATQAVFNLYVIEGYGHKEIGLLLQITEGTSKWHLSEARKKLQQLLKQEQNKY